MVFVHLYIFLHFYLFVLNRRDLDFAAQDGCAHRQVGPDHQIISLALKQIVFLDVGHHVEITGRAAIGSRFSFAGYFEPASGLHAGRDLDV